MRRSPPPEIRPGCGLIPVLEDSVSRCAIAITRAIVTDAKARNARLKAIYCTVTASRTCVNEIEAQLMQIGARSVQWESVPPPLLSRASLSKSLIGQIGSYADRVVVLA
jgi:hypothetical protein